MKYITIRKDTKDIKGKSLDLFSIYDLLSAEAKEHL